MRFWNFQVLQETEEVMEAIWLALDVPPTLTLPRKGGGKFLEGEKSAEAVDLGFLGDLSEG